MLRQLGLVGVLVAASGLYAAAGGKEKSYLGVMLADLSNTLKTQLKIEGGVAITEVLEDSPAELGGLQDADIVTAINGQTVKNERGFRKTLRNLPPGTEVTLDVVREGARQSVKATLSEWPEDQDSDHDFDFGWNWDWDGDAPMAQSLANCETHVWLKDMIGDIHDGKNVKVEIECKDGKGLAKIDRDGTVETKEFNCDEAKGFGHTFRMFHGGGDEDVAIAMIPPDAPAPPMPPGRHGRHMMAFKREFAQPQTRFKVDGDKIEVATTKDGAELTQVFANEQELAQKSPELYEKYQNLKSELNSDSQD